MPRHRIKLDSSTLNCVAAGMDAEDGTGDLWFGVKSYVTGKRSEHWMLLFNDRLGLQAVMAGRRHGELRTGAASGVSIARHAAPGDVTLACVGAGRHARSQIAGVFATRPVSEVRIWSRDITKAEALAAEVTAQYGVPAVAAATVTEAARSATAVITITKAKEPVLHGADIEPGTHVVLAGGNAATRSEADPELFARATSVFVDNLDQAQRESGELINAVAAGAIGWDAVKEFHTVEPVADGGISVFCSHGVGLWDTVLAHTVVQRALAAGRGDRR
jgi:alanine dehydrogenase